MQDSLHKLILHSILCHLLLQTYTNKFGIAQGFHNGNSLDVISSYPYPPIIPTPNFKFPFSKSYPIIPTVI